MIAPVQITISKARKKPTPIIIPPNSPIPLNQGENALKNIHSKMTVPNPIKIYFHIFFTISHSSVKSYFLPRWGFGFFSKSDFCAIRFNHFFSSSDSFL